MNRIEINSRGSLIEVLKNAPSTAFPNFGSKSYFEKYIELDKHFAEYPVEMGAMKSEIEKSISEMMHQLKTIMLIKDEKERVNKTEELFKKIDPVIFLNKHGPEHTAKVCDRAFDILKCFSHDNLNYYELFFLLCSISVHDVGNMYGRHGHEKQIKSMVEAGCKDLLDNVELQRVSQIAGVHGGKINDAPDTISHVKVIEKIHNIAIREQLISAVLRFADELADDYTRANYSALKAGTLGASEMFHVYSSKLHTVSIDQNPITSAWEISLGYEFDDITAQKKFQKIHQEDYLLNEIYKRTVKMEQERRYCMRYMRPFCSIDRINVEIVIDDSQNSFVQYPIKYTLEEKGYPIVTVDDIKKDNTMILSGEEMANKLGAIR